MYQLTTEQKLENLNEVLALKEKKLQNLQKEIDGLRKKIERISSKNSQSQNN